MIEVHIGRYIPRVVWTALLLLAAPAAAQVALPTDMAIVHDVLVPRSRALAFGEAPNVRITGVDVGVVILEQAARTTIDVHLRNGASRDQEVELLLPVPAGAAIRRFAFDGEAAEPTARLLPKAEASSTYNAFVAQVRDTALLEFAGHDLVRSSVFPVPARGSQQIRVTYDHLLERDGERVDYLLPRSESIGYDVPWTITVQVQSAHSLATLVSPSHDIETIRGASNRVSARLSDAAASEPGPFRLSYLLAGDGATTDNAFVPRQLGEDGTCVPSQPAADPRVAESNDEIVDLPTEYGILTEYTAFLALGGTDLSDRDDVMARAAANFQDRQAIERSSGLLIEASASPVGSPRAQARTRRQGSSSW
jgi:hypothetical protein